MVRSTMMSLLRAEYLSVIVNEETILRPWPLSISIQAFGYPLRARLKLPGTSHSIAPNRYDFLSGIRRILLMTYKMKGKDTMENARQWITVTCRSCIEMTPN